MSEHLQPLLDRIHSEGLRKAEAEREDILSQARKEAEAITAAARQQAETLAAEAASKAEASEQRAKAAIQQAARDSLLTFRAELTRQVNAAAKSAAAAQLSSTELVGSLLKQLLEHRSETGAITVEAGSKLAGTLEQLLPALLRDLGSKAETQIHMNPRSGEGFRLKFADSAAVLDLTDAAVANWLAAYLRPELASLLQADPGV